MPHQAPSALEVLTADYLATLDSIGSYTPVLTASTTNPNLGADGSITGAWHRAGHMISGWVRVHFAGTGVNAGSGTYMISLPFDPDPAFHTFALIVAGSTHFGSGFLEDASTTANRTSIETYLREAPNRMGFRTASGTSVTHADPFTWATGDRISLHFAYIANAAGLP